MQKLLLLFVCLGVVLASGQSKDLGLQTFSEFLGQISPQHAQTKAESYIAYKGLEYEAALIAWTKADDAAKDFDQTALDAWGMGQDPKLVQALKKSAADAKIARDKAAVELSNAQKRWDDAKANAQKWTAAQWAKLEASDQAWINYIKSAKENALKKVAIQIENAKGWKNRHETLLASIIKNENLFVQQRNQLMATSDWKQLIQKYGFNPIDPINLPKLPKNFNQSKDLTAAQFTRATTVLNITNRIDTLIKQKEVQNQAIAAYEKILSELYKQQKKAQNMP